jgi:uncharacterized membrane protein
VGAVWHKITAPPASATSKLSKALTPGALGISAILLLLPILFRLDGKVHADWQQLLGRFHPLVVHLPIGLLLLVPVLELAGRYRPALREAASFVLALSVFGCLSAVMLGYLLAYGSGATGTDVTRHMWGGIALSIAVMLCWFLRRAWDDSGGARSNAYPAMLVLVLLLLSWTAHMGGSVTHGDNYLFEYLPSGLKHLTGLGNAPPKSPLVLGSVFAKHIFPALDNHCVACHGDGKVKGGLRLDSYESLLKGGEIGPAVVPGQPAKSLLLQRVTLPSTHTKFMPADGKPPLKAEDIEIIRAWIAQGASPSATKLTGISLPGGSDDAPLPQVPDYSQKMAAMKQVAQTLSVTLTQVSANPGDGLILNTVDAAPGFNDAQLAQFEPFAPYIVEVQLGRTSVTDASFATLAKFIHLRALHLEGTVVTGNGLAQLSGLNYLNLSGTQVTSAAVAPLKSDKTLRHLYLFNTPAEPVTTGTADEASPRKTL